MKTILPSDSAIHRHFEKLIDKADIAFFVGLPGVGKSLLLQQMTLMALAAGRSAHLLQWDRSRLPFEGPRYPLQDGATHPMVIKAVGLWLREELVAWSRGHHSDDMLIGEAPLIGGRLMELARPADDSAEPLLNDERTRFILPVPSRKLRTVIEAARERSMANPRHVNEKHDAPPGLLRELWRDFFRTAAELGLAGSQTNDADYAPDIYEAVYRRLLTHRHLDVLSIDRPLEPLDSVYAFDRELPQLAADHERARSILAALEASTTAANLRDEMARWHEV